MLLRLQKILNQSGISSRRQAEKYILHGKVSVNGTIVKTLGVKADTDKDKIFFDGKPVKLEKKIYILLNKAKGYICTAKDSFSSPTVFNLIKGIKQRLFTVGRLDKDTEGLLILTNDGQFANRLMHPSFKKKKVYEVLLNRKLLERNKKKIEHGIVLDGKRTLPCEIKISTKYPKVLITIYEGRKRQIRRMFDFFDYKIIKLKRIQEGPIKIGSLKTGKFRYLKKSEIKKLLSQN